MLPVVSPHMLKSLWPSLVAEGLVCVILSSFTNSQAGLCTPLLLPSIDTSDDTGPSKPSVLRITVPKKVECQLKQFAVLPKCTFSTKQVKGLRRIK